MPSTQTMLKQIAALLGTEDLSEWEAGFVEGIKDRQTTTLSGKQIEIVERIWQKHFA